MPKVLIELGNTLYAVLERYADEECRLPSGQATWLVRQALRARLQHETAAIVLVVVLLLLFVTYGPAGKAACRSRHPGPFQGSLRGDDSCNA